MLLLSKKNIIKRAILVGFLVVSLVALAIGTIKRVQFQASAVTADGASVKITKGESISYGHGWATSVFSITTGGQKITGYCANPSKKSLSGTFPAVKMPNTENNNLIKLMIYVSTVDNSITRPVMNDLFSSISNSDKRYAYSHAVIGAIYANDYHRLESSDRTLVNGIITKLRNLINNDADAWVIAKSYQLYTIDRSGTAYADDDDYQDIMWAENDYKSGDIKVEKRDSATHSTTPQGGASLQGITFSVYNNNGSRIYSQQTGQFYNNGALVTSGTTNANGVVTFSNLPAGTYSVKETGTNSSYDLTATASQNVTIATNGETKTVSFEDNVKKGLIAVFKKDKELTTCNQLGKAKFTGIKFQIINDSAKPVYYGGNSIANGSVVAEKTLTATDCGATFNDLPYGQYKVKEVGSGVGYLTDSTVHTVTIPNGSSTSISVSFSNQVIRGDVKFKKINSNSNQSMANIPFRITSKTTGESHIVVTDSNGVVNTAASVNAHTNHTNGYDSISNMDTITYQGYGTWFGKSASSSSATAAANNSLGALPYDTYEIVEISCEQNQYCINIEAEKQTFSITSNNTVVDLGNWENDCVDFTLGTTATDNADGDKYIVAGTNAKIKDVINYCLKAGMDFTIKGTLWDKTANREIAGSEKTITVSPTTDDCGQAEMIFTVNASSLAGHEIVVFEKAYHGDDLVAAHDGVNDAAQTVNVISLGTTATDNADGDKFVVASANAKIKDDVAYCLKTGTEYTIKGVLMDKSTGAVLKINGSTIEKSIKVTPTSNCGNATMVFELDASILAGREVVVYETVYQGDNHKVISHEDINDAAQTVSVISLATTATDNKDGDKYVFAGSGAKVKDVINYCVKPGVKYTIKGTLMDKTTNAAITTKEIEITPTAACGQAEMIFDFNAASLAGHDAVVFEELYYNNVLIAEHKDLNDVAQTVTIVSLGTTAVDNADNNKYLANDANAKIKDTINYCLKAGTEFTIKGVLMDKTTGEALMINGSKVEKSVKVTPTTNCGTVNMIFELDASALSGHEIVVYETAYQNNKLVVAHESINDAAQTVTVVSLATVAVDNTDEDKFIEAGPLSTIKDTVEYCLKVGIPFVIKGSLVDKTTGDYLIDNEGNLIEKAITITPTTACGEVELIFELDTSLLAGHEIVVFENAYQNGPVIASHQDINDVAQIVSMINFSTFAENGKEEEPEEEEEETEEDKAYAEMIKKHVEAVEGAKIKDTITYCLKSNTEFTIKGTLIDKETGEPLMVDEEVIEESVVFTTEDACGQVEMMFEIDATSLAGHEVVVFERLYYNNEFVMSHEDIEDEDQTVYLVDLTTFATDSETKKKELTANGVVKIKDVVKYCLRAGLEFTVKGILMDKETEKPLLVDGKTVEQTITFIPEDRCGETEMLYEFDATGLGGTDVVIFEDIYLGKSLLIRHEDFGNTDETFYLLAPAPDTGFITRTEDGGSEQNNLVFVGISMTVTSVLVYGAMRINRRRKIFNH